MSKDRKDEYDRIYNYNNEDSINYEEADENETPEEAIERLRGTIGRGDCLYCGGHNTMEYDGCICFICSACGWSIYEELYYRWAAGYSVEFEEE